MIMQLKIQNLKIKIVGHVKEIISDASFDLKEGELISPWILRDKIEKEE